MYLMEVAKQLEAAALKLNSKARPGHIEYISKDRAAEWLLTIVKDLRAAQANPTEELQAEELYKRAFDDGAMATQTHLENLRVSQLDEECERLRIVNRDLKVQVQRWIEKASQLEQSLAEAKQLVNNYVEEVKKLNRSNAAHLREHHSIRIERDAAVAAKQS